MKNSYMKCRQSDETVIMGSAICESRCPVFTTN